MAIKTSSQARTAVRRLTVSRVISLTGGAAAYLALNFYIFQRTGSATWLAATLFLTFGAEGLAGPFAGAIGDRFDRKKVMIASDLLAAVVFLAMALTKEPGLLLALGFCSALAEAPFYAASTAALPNLVGEDKLSWANGMVSLGRNAGVLIGPVLGGVLVSSIGAGAVFALNAVSFVVSAAIVVTVHGRFKGDAREEDGEFRGLRAGFRFVWRDRVLRILAFAWLAIVLGLGMTMVADVPLVGLFGAGSFGYGLLIAFWGGGSIAGSLLGRYLNARTEPVALVAGSALVAVTCVAVGLSPWFVLVLGAVLAMGVGDGLTLVAEQGLIQRRTPDAVRSRVSGAMETVIHGGLALSYLFAGPAVGALGPRAVYVVGGAAALAGTAVALPVVRATRRVPEPAGPPTEEPAGAEAEGPALLLP
jgi:MFS family permease